MVVDVDETSCAHGLIPLFHLFGPLQKGDKGFIGDGKDCIPVVVAPRQGADAAADYVANDAIDGGPRQVRRPRHRLPVSFCKPMTSKPRAVLSGRKYRFILK